MEEVTLTSGVGQSGVQALWFEYEAETGAWTWSPGLRALYTLPRDQAPDIDVFLSRVVDQDRPVLQARFEQSLKRPGPYSCVYRMVDADGAVRRVILAGQGVVGARQVQRVTGFVVDITEPLRESARAAVAASSEHRAAIEQAKGAVMLSFGVEEEVAFDLLRTYSSQLNIKLAVVAERIVAGLSDPGFSREDPVQCLLDIVLDLGDQAVGEAEDEARQQHA